MHSYTSKCPRRWRERNTVTLECFFNFGEFLKARIKQTLLSYMSFVFFIPYVIPIPSESMLLEIANKIELNIITPLTT